MKLAIPLQKKHDYLNISERFISPVFDKRKLMAKLQNAYVKAPYLKEIIPFLGSIAHGSIFFDNYTQCIAKQ